jgi:hypothetical protein
MRRVTSLIGMAVLVVAACGGTASQTATAAPATAAPTAATQARATPAPATPVPVTAAPPAVSANPVALVPATVTFDGKACTYVGPAVVPTGSTMVFTLVNAPEALTTTKGAALYVLPVKDGTTWEQVLADAKKYKQSNVPDWARYPGATVGGLGEMEILFPGTAAAGDILTVEVTRPAYYVGCGTGPTDTDTAFPAILLNVLKG